MEQPEENEDLERWFTIQHGIKFKLPCECKYYLQQYRDYESQENERLTYAGDLETADIITIAASRARLISQYRSSTRCLVYHYGDMIAKRWQKLSRSERRDTLSRARQDMHSEQNLLVDLFPCLRNKTLKEQRAFRKAYLVQYLNLTTLSDESTRLIRLLHHRISWYPKDFVPFDNAQIQLVWHQGRVEERRAYGCIMMTGHEYGVWKPFNREDVHNGSAYGAPRALLILEAQELIMSFLQKVISIILAGRTSAQDLTRVIEISTTHFGRLDEADGCRDWNKLVSSSLLSDNAQPWSPFGAIQHNPFAEPPRFDSDSIIEIAENQTLEMQDEFWLLQTEPNYFYERAKCLNEWWYDKVEGFDKIDRVKIIKHDNIAYALTIKAYQRARDWQWILQQCLIVKQAREGYMCQRQTGTLPKQYEQALGGLSFLMSRAWEDCRKSLHLAMSRSRVFGSSYKPRTAGYCSIGGAVAPGAIIDIVEYSTLWDRDRITWCLYWITRDREDHRTFPATSVLQYLEQILSTKSNSPACTESQKQALDQEMRSYISNLTALDKMFALLDLHRPVFKVPSSLLNIDADEQVWRVLRKMLYNSPETRLASDMALGSACFPLVNFIIPKGIKNHDWLAKRDLAHKALTKLWRRARGEYQRSLEICGVAQADIDPHLNEMCQSESPEHHNRLEEERERILSRINKAHERKYAQSLLQIQKLPDFAVSMVAEKTNKRKEIQVPSRPKTKTRPEIDNVALGPETVAQKTEYAGQQKAPVLYTFKKQSKPHRLISRVFPHDIDGPQQAGKMSWQDFVAAWRNLGCKVEHYGGSAHTFRGDIFVPSDPEQPQQRSITVHRPHPDDTLSSVMLHGIGRRLSRRFGWEREHFAFTKY